VHPLVHRNLINGLGLLDERRCADVHRTREIVRLLAERSVRGDDRAQVSGCCGEGGRQGLEDGLNVLRKLGSCGLRWEYERWSGVV
jgi:hypothetical protein